MTKASILAVFFGELHCTSILVGCNRDFDKHGGIVLWFLMMVYMFKALGTICDEYFVPSLEVIVEKLQVSNDVAGATFMAAGSSAPELFTSLVSTFLIMNAAGVGTIVGSAIFNILVMNGVVAFVACQDKDLEIWWYPLVRDSSFYLISIAELVIVLSDEEVQLWEGLIMISTYLVYCLYMKFNPNIIKALGIIVPGDDVVEVPNGNGCSDEEVADSANGISGGAADSANGISGGTAVVPTQCIGRPGELKEQTKWSYRHSQASDRQVSPERSDRQVSPERQGSVERQVPCGENSNPSSGCSETKTPGDTEPPPLETSASGSVTNSSQDERSERRRRFCRDPFVVFWEFTMPSPGLKQGVPLFSLSIMWIFICTYVMVDSTGRIGEIMTVPPFVMGLIFLAAGTSIPDTLGSLAVARQGEGDMAIANALGSNVFDILIGLGVPWTIRCISGKEVTFHGQFDDFIWDILILVGSVFIFVACLWLKCWRLDRKMGLILIGIYCIFVLYQMLAVFAFKWKEVDERRLFPMVL